VKSWRPPTTIETLPETEQLAKRQKLSHTIGGMMREPDTASNLFAEPETECRKASFEWCVAVQNAMTQGLGFGLEKFQVSAEQLKNLDSAIDWDQYRLCGDYDT